ncbi:MAG: hypothetical protein JXX29_15635 [Deltaproteobacteria bacterium]|nr:hypothetical protein [Deltaproteobacteria bacterium]MBN2673112.1 hypothetical protein [Deltaproteobacteria bacterium]
MIGTGKNCNHDQNAPSLHPKEFPILGTSEKWVAKLCADSKSEREQAAVWLLEHGTPETLVSIAKLLFTDISSQTHATCLDILEKHDVAASLKDLAQDGWLDEVKAEAENFHIVSRIVGERYLAYSILLGLQIQSIKKDIEFHNRTLVQFTSDSDMVQALPLGQFRLQVTSVLLSIGIQASDKIEYPLTESNMLQLIGELPLLVAPLFGISLKRLIAIQLPAQPYTVLGITTPSGHVYIELKDFRNIILRLIQNDLEKLGEEKLELQLDTSEAKAAFEKQDLDRVHHLLQTWPGLLSTLLKSPIKNELNDNQLQQIAEGTQMLAAVYLKQEKYAWAKETLRLGVRYTCDSSHAGPLYLALGKLYNQTEDYGESIGYLRRALAFNEDAFETYTALSDALFFRNKKLCAYLLMKEAKTLHPLPPPLQQRFDEVKQTMREKEIGWPG